MATLPFLSQRYAVRAAQVITQTPAENVGAYDQMIRDVLANLTGPFSDQTRQPGDGAPHRARRAARRRRAGGAVDHGVQRPGRDLPDRRPLRGPGSPAPAAVGAGGRAGALLRRAAGRRLRRAGQHQRGLPDRGGPRHPGPGHRPADHRRAAGCGRSPARSTSCSPIPTRTARTSCGCGWPRPRTRGCASSCWRRCRTRWRSGSTRSSRSARTPTGRAARPPPGRPAELFADYCAASQVDDPRVNRLFDELHDDLTSGRA